MFNNTVASWDWADSLPSFKVPQMLRLRCYGRAIKCPHMRVHLRGPWKAHALPPIVLLWRVKVEDRGLQISHLVMTAAWTLVEDMGSQLQGLADFPSSAWEAQKQAYCWAEWASTRQAHGSWLCCWQAEFQCVTTNRGLSLKRTTSFI